MTARNFFISLVMTVFLASPASAANYGKDDFVYKFYIDINNQAKGLLTIAKTQNSFQSEYFGVTTEDRLPFYSRKKTGSYRDGAYATSLRFDDEEFAIYYEKDKAPREVDEFLRGDSNQKAIVWNTNTGRPRLSFDRIPAVTLENILLGMMNRSIRVGEYYYLLEGGKNAGIRLYCEKEGSIPADAGADVKCASESYLFKRTNVPGEPDVPLFRVLVNKDNVPLRVLSNSGRWGLRLGGIARGAQPVQLDMNQALIEMARKDFHAKATKAAGEGARFSTFDFSIASQKGDLITYDFQLKASGLVGEDDLALAARLFSERMNGHRQAANSRLAKNFEVDGDWFYVEVDNDEVCDEYRKSFVSGKVDKSCATLTRERSLSVSQAELYKFVVSTYGCDIKTLEYKGGWLGSDKLACTAAGVAQDIEVKTALSGYLAGRGDLSGALLKDYSTEKDFNEYHRFRLTLEQQEAVEPQQLDNQAAKLLAAKVTGQPFVSRLQGLKDVQFQKTADGYRLATEKSAVQRYRNDLSAAECKQLAGSLGAHSPQATTLTGGVCQIRGEISRNVREAVIELEDNIYREYVDLKLTGTKIDKKGNLWSFDYISGFEGFKDGCY